MTVGLSLAAPAAAALGAPKGVWIGVAVAAGVCFVAAVGSHVLEGRVAAVRPTEDALRERSRQSAEQREQSTESNSRIALADGFAQLHGEGRKLRREIKPDLSDPWRALARLGTIFRYPSAPISAERNVRWWAERVQDQLALSAPRFMPEWERGLSLPPPPLMQTSFVADGAALVRFLDARLDMLENIIRELREGR